jgi:hypothetical protein
MKEKKTCEHCGAKIVEYKHSFSKALAIGLYRLYQENRPVNIKHLGLTRNQWDNFQKLRYWGLVAKAVDDAGKRVGGCWAVTQLGVDFIENGTSIQKFVWTYRGETVRFDGDTCFFNDVHPVEYKQRTDYAQEAVSHFGG